MALKHNEVTAHNPEHLHKQGDSSTRRQFALERATELREKIKEYLSVRGEIPTGFDLVDEYLTARTRILDALEASDADWGDWHWQLRNRIDTVDSLSRFVDLTDKEKEELNEVSSQLRWAISPYYMALVMCDKPMAVPGSNPFPASWKSPIATEAKIQWLKDGHLLLLG